MAKCKGCKEREAIQFWGKYQFCQSCGHIIHTMWEADFLRRRRPDLIQYIPNQELDNLGFQLLKMDEEDRIYKKLDEFGIKLKD